MGSEWRECNDGRVMVEGVDDGSVMVEGGG